MKARWLVNFALFALVVTLGISIRNEVSDVPKPPTLSDLLPINVVRVEIARQGEPTIKLLETPKGWLMESPFTVDANADQIDKLLGILGTEVHRSIPEQSVNPRELRLSPPKLRLQIDGLRLAIGGTDPVNNDRYVATGGLVHLIDDRFFHLMIAPPIDYVSPRLLPRGFDPAFGRMDGVPLATDALAGLSSVKAERVERLPPEFSGSPAEIEVADGSAIRFLVSPDRRRWARPDLKLLYVLTDPPTLTEDPEAIDPTPNPPAAAVAPFPDAVDPAEEQVPDEVEYDPADPFSPFPEEPLVEGVDDAFGDLETGGMNGAPPAVHLSPKGYRSRPKPQPQARELPVMPAEPDQTPSQMDAPANPKGVFGYGQDPFAPDPSQE